MKTPQIPPYGADLDNDDHVCPEWADCGDSMNNRDNPIAKDAYEQLVVDVSIRSDQSPVNDLLIRRPAKFDPKLSLDAQVVALITQIQSEYSQSSNHEMPSPQPRVTFYSSDEQSITEDDQILVSAFADHGLKLEVRLSGYFLAFTGFSVPTAAWAYLRLYEESKQYETRITALETQLTEALSNVPRSA